MSSNCCKIHKAYENFLVIRYIIILHITEYTNKVQINNNNKILLLYMIDAFYLYHKYIKKLLYNYGKIYEANKSFLAITIICYIIKYIYKVQINNNNKISLSYMIDIFIYIIDI